MTGSTARSAATAWQLDRSPLSEAHELLQPRGHLAFWSALVLDPAVARAVAEPRVATAV